MPMLADLDDPQPPRWPGLLLGLAFAVPVAAVLVGWLLPALVSSILGGARDLDTRLRAGDAYMRTLCATAMDPARDLPLCECVLAMEVPSLDCGPPWLEWQLARHRDTCATDAGRNAISFCACVEQIDANLEHADPSERTTIVSAYERCSALDDALPLPAVGGLESGG